MAEHNVQTSYSIGDFDYDLPQELIAQTPIEPRDASRLLVLHRATGAIEHRLFHNIGEYLYPGDLLIANQSRVIPARLMGKRVETGGAVEVLLLAERPEAGPDHWETLVRPGRRLQEGARVIFGGEDGGAMLHAEIMQHTDAGGRIVRFWVENNTDDNTSYVEAAAYTSIQCVLERHSGSPLDRRAGQDAAAAVYSRDAARPGTLSDCLRAH